jgi:ketosteroid isomerase-like protein
LPARDDRGRFVASERPSAALIALVQRYLDLVADPTSDLAAIEAVLDPEFRFIEHSNLMSPAGSERDRTIVLDSIPQGRMLLSSQRFEVHDHAVVGDTRVITRAFWEGRLAMGAGLLGIGSSLRADLAMFFDVRDGRIVRQENFDCYQPPQLG